MDKQITVKGIGNAIAKPDLVVLSLELETSNPDYDRCMELAGEKNDLLKAAIVKSGLPEGSLKTSNFDMSSKYRSVKDKFGNYKSVFDCWKCCHDFKVEFSLDVKFLTHVLRHVAKSMADCKVNMDFTISDPSAVQTALLESAAKNALKKAETLCSALGAKLGELVKIDYSWSEIKIFSSTECKNIDWISAAEPESSVPEIDPEDIKLRDTATFVWKIG